MRKITLLNDMGTGGTGVRKKFTRFVRSGRQLIIQVDGITWGTASVTKIGNSRIQVRVRRQGRSIDSFSLPSDFSARVVAREIRGVVQNALYVKKKDRREPRFVRRGMGNQTLA